MLTTNETTTAAHAKGWISASNPRLHHLIEESQPGFWTECRFCLLAALRDTAERGSRAIERVAADGGCEGIVLEVWYHEPVTVDGLFKGIGSAVLTLAGGGTPNGKEEGCRITITASNPTQFVEREVIYDGMVAMRDGHLTPEYLALMQQSFSQEDEARGLADLKDMQENGGGFQFADFWPELKKIVEGT